MEKNGLHKVAKVDKFFGPEAAFAAVKHAWHCDKFYIEGGGRVSHTLQDDVLDGDFSVTVK